MNELRNADEQLKKYEHDIEILKREIGAKDDGEFLLARFINSPVNELIFTFGFSCFNTQ